MARPSDSPDEEVRLQVGWFVGVDWGDRAGVAQRQSGVRDRCWSVRCSESGRSSMAARAFAVASIRHWWHQMGCGYPEATTLSAMADWWLSFAAGAAGAVGVAIETPREPVVESLMEHGIAVHSVNPKQLDRFRDRLSPAGTGVREGRRSGRAGAGLGVAYRPALFSPAGARCWPRRCVPTRPS